MRAIDTNILIRFLTDDDAEQSPLARKVMATGQVFVPTTVFLEAEWVLRRGYELDKNALSHALRVVAGLPSVVLEEPDRIALALEWFDKGLGLADALHLAGAADQCDAFLTFDRKLVRRAQGLSAIEVQPPGEVL